MQKYYKHNIMFCRKDIMIVSMHEEPSEDYAYLTEEEFERLCIMMNSEDIDTRHLAYEIFKEKVKERIDGHI